MSGLRKLNTGSRKHAVTDPLASPSCRLRSEGRFQELLHQFALYFSTTWPVVVQWEIKHLRQPQPPGLGSAAGSLCRCDTIGEMSGLSWIARNRRLAHSLFFLVL